MHFLISVVLLLLIQFIILPGQDFLIIVSLVNPEDFVFATNPAGEIANE